MTKKITFVQNKQNLAVYNLASYYSFDKNKLKVGFTVKINQTYKQNVFKFQD